MMRTRNGIGADSVAVYGFCRGVLKGLDVDCINLLQIHWPDRYTGGTVGQPDLLPSKYEEQEELVLFEKLLAAWQQPIEDGKVRYIRESNGLHMVSVV